MSASQLLDGAECICLSLGLKPGCLDTDGNEQSAPSAIDETKEMNEDVHDITVYCRGTPGGKAFGGCPYSQKVLICLELHQLQYNRKLIDAMNKPLSFTNLNKRVNNEWEFISGDDWKYTFPVLEDKKKKVRIFDSADICAYLEKHYKPSALSKNAVDIETIPGAKTVFIDLKKLAQDVGSRNDGIFNREECNVELFDKFTNALKGIDKYLGDIYRRNNNQTEGIYLNGSKEISLLDIELIPQLHHCCLMSDFALNIDVTAYKNLASYMVNAYKQGWWQKVKYSNRICFGGWYQAFGIKAFKEEDRQRMQQNSDKVKEREIEQGLEVSMLQKEIHALKEMQQLQMQKIEQLSERNTRLLIQKKKLISYYKYGAYLCSVGAVAYFLYRYTVGNDTQTRSARSRRRYR